MRVEEAPSGHVCQNGGTCTGPSSCSCHAKFEGAECATKVRTWTAETQTTPIVSYGPCASCPATSKSCDCEFVATGCAAIASTGRGVRSCGSAVREALSSATGSQRGFRACANALWYNWRTPLIWADIL